jgi:predicted nucleotidyltransferase
MKRKSGLAEALFSRGKWQVISTLFGHSEKEWYLSEIALKSGTTPSSLQRDLALLVRAGLLHKRRDGNRVYYQANASSPLFRELRGLVLKTSGLVEPVRQSLEVLGKRVDVAFVFGSVATGEARSTSDIDLFVVGSLQLSDLSRVLVRAERLIARPVNPMVYSREELRDAVESGNHFLSSVLSGPKLYIMGSESDLERATGRGIGSSSHNEPAGD